MDSLHDGDVNDTFVTTSKAARLLGVSQRTIHYWMDRGVIKSWKTVGGHCRIPMSSINRLLAKRREELSESDGSQLTILLVEDDIELRTIAREVIANWGLPVRLIVAEDGFDGLIQAGLNKPDVIIADLMMPAMDGFQMIQKLQGAPELNHPRIIVVTGMEPEAVAAQGTLPPEIDILYKPTPYPHLKAMVQEALKHRG
ncbi:MAG: response regulator [Magnetococcales bacterium]|nr:response regulator [Magnetococcales bacterium]